MTHSSEIKKLASLIKSLDKKIIVISGAGVSTAAGIPDYRTKGTGLYENTHQYNINQPEDLFDIEFFRKNPKPFYSLVKEIYPGKLQPTKFHFLAKLFESKGLLKAIYTQNFDTLEKCAGNSEEFIVQAHGSFNSNHCIDCGEEYSVELFKKRVFEGEDPLCLSCDGFVKPDIVFYHEGLPERFFQKMDNSIREMRDSKSETYITITAGSSLTVYPFAELPSLTPSKQLRVLVNKERVGDFKHRPRKSDLIFLQDIDEFADSLSDLLGWKDELDELIINWQNDRDIDYNSGKTDRNEQKEPEEDEDSNNSEPETVEVTELVSTLDNLQINEKT